MMISLMKRRLWGGMIIEWRLNGTPLLLLLLLLIGHKSW